MIHAHYLQHVPFEGLGSMAPWLGQRGFEITCTRFFESWALPDVDALDLLVVMGGPMSVNDEGEYPWLPVEKAFIRDYIATGRPLLGICLGAQLAAAALGAAVYPNAEKEIGWFPVQAIIPEDPACFRFPPSMQVFHWHGDTFDLPEGAVRIARSAGCENQAFQRGDSVIGLQFHLETTPETASELVAKCRDELVPARYVQTEDEILAAAPQRYRLINRQMERVLSFLTQNVP